MTKDARIIVWKLSNGQVVFTGDYPVHTKRVTGMLIHGDKIFSSSMDATVRATSLIYKY